MNFINLNWTGLTSSKQYLIIVFALIILKINCRILKVKWLLSWYMVQAKELSYNKSYNLSLNRIVVRCCKVKRHSIKNNWNVRIGITFKRFLPILQHTTLTTLTTRFIINYNYRLNLIKKILGSFWHINKRTRNERRIPVDIGLKKFTLILE